MAGELRAVISAVLNHGLSDRRLFSAVLPGLSSWFTRSLSSCSCWWQWGRNQEFQRSHRPPAYTAVPCPGERRHPHSPSGAGVHLEERTIRVLVKLLYNGAENWLFEPWKSGFNISFSFSRLLPSSLKTFSNICFILVTSWVMLAVEWQG